MPNKFISDYNNLTQQQFAARYIAPVIVAAFAILLLGQLAMQFCTVSQLNKAEGRVTKTETAIVGYTHHRGKSGSAPDYATAITLDNGSIHYVEYVPLRQKLDTLLHVNDMVAIYSPDKVLKILSAGMIANVAQLERGKQMVYSFNEEKHRAWLLVGVFAAIIAAFGMFIYFYRA